MNNPIDPSNSTCAGCMGASCPSSCPTRVGVLRSALSAFLTANPARARYGAVAFPSQAAFSPTGCAPASSQAVPMLAPSVASTPSTLSAQTQLMQTFVAGIGTTTLVSGGTPTGPTLAYAATIPAIASSTLPRGVVVITDGLPNCNPANPLSCMTMPPPPADLCTIGSACTNGYCQAGYLDQTATVQAVAALRFAGVRTAVVVLGPPTVQQTATMNAMADEGGATACSVTNPGCLQRFFPANDEASLTLAIGNAVARAVVP